MLDAWLLVPGAWRLVLDAQSDIKHQASAIKHHPPSGNVLRKDR